MTEAGNGNFEGTFPDTLTAYRAIRDLYESAPGFTQVAKNGMKLGMERIHRPIPLIGRLQDENVDGVSYHSATVGFAVNSLADFLRLSSSERNVMVTAAGLHDSSKVIEMQMAGYREVMKGEREKSEATDSEQLMQAKSALQEVLTKTGVITDNAQFDRIIKEIEGLDSLEFATFFDGNINRVFLEKVLSSLHPKLESNVEESILTIAGADSLGQLPALIARVNFLAERKSIQLKSADALSFVVTKLQEKKLLPDIVGSVQFNLMAMGLVYCDAISRGDKIVTIDDRQDKLVRGGKYKELDNAAADLYGMKLSEANRMVLHAAEEILMASAVENGYIEEGTPPVDLPNHIFKNILKRANARADRK